MVRISSPTFFLHRQITLMGGSNLEKTAMWVTGENDGRQGAVNIIKKSPDPDLVNSCLKCNNTITRVEK